MHDTAWDNFRQHRSLAGTLSTRCPSCDNLCSYCVLVYTQTRHFESMCAFSNNISLIFHHRSIPHYPHSTFTWLPKLVYFFCSTVSNRLRFTQLHIFHLKLTFPLTHPPFIRHKELTSPCNVWASNRYLTMRHNRDYMPVRTSPTLPRLPELRSSFLQMYKSYKP